MRKFGIPVVADLKGVGEGLVDHVMVRNTVFETKSKNPPISGNMSEAHILWKSEDATDAPDIHFLFIQIPLGAKNLPIDRGYAIVPALVRPLSTGSVRLEGTGPDSRLRIDPNYLAEEADMRRLSRAVALAREIGNAMSFDEIRQREVAPGSVS